MNFCGYTDRDEDFYGNEYECGLPAGHEGLHREVHEWATRPADVCAALGHDWTKWTPYRYISPLGAHLSEHGFVATDIFPDVELRWKTEPTHRRSCRRCRTVDLDGVLEDGPTTWTIYDRDAFTRGDRTSPG